MKSILLHIDHDPAMTARLQVALDIARRFNAHLKLVQPCLAQDFVAFDMAGGAHFVAHAEPFEKLKLRMVNGSHSAIAYLGVLAGWYFKLQVLDHDECHAAGRRYMAQELLQRLESARGGADADDRERRCGRVVAWLGARGGGGL